MSVAAEFTAPGEEHEVVGAVPVLDDVEAVVDFPPQSLVVQIAAQEDGLDGLAELGQGFVGGMLNVVAREATQDGLGLGGAEA